MNIYNKTQYCIHCRKKICRILVCTTSNKYGSPPPQVQLEPLMSSNDIINIIEAIKWNAKTCTSTIMFQILNTEDYISNKPSKCDNAAHVK